MSSENIDNNLETIPEEVPEVPKVRRMRGPGKKEIKLTQQPTYSKDYWLAKRSAAILCVNCGKMVCKGKMYRHIKTPICKNTQRPQRRFKRLKTSCVAIGRLIFRSSIKYKHFSKQVSPLCLVVRLKRPLKGCAR